MILRKLFAKSISLYQRYISRYTRRSCVFYPTCSEYAKQAVLKYGVAKGLYLAIRRIMRCHPWQKRHIDPLP